MNKKHFVLILANKIIQRNTEIELRAVMLLIG